MNNARNRDREYVAALLRKRVHGPVGEQPKHRVTPPLVACRYGEPPPIDAACVRCGFHDCGCARTALHGALKSVEAHMIADAMRRIFKAAIEQTNGAFVPTSCACAVAHEGPCKSHFGRYLDRSNAALAKLVLGSENLELDQAPMPGATALQRRVVQLRPAHDCHQLVWSVKPVNGGVDVVSVSVEVPGRNQALGYVHRSSTDEAIADLWSSLILKASK